MGNKTTPLPGSVVVSLVFLASVGYAATSFRQGCFQDQCFKIEVMSSPGDRARGLMFRDSLPEGYAMFFVFEQPGKLAFWMKNMKFPIDILWLNDQERVVHIEPNVPPCVKASCPAYSPPVDALYVLEIPAGNAVSKNILLNSQLTWK